MQFQGKLIIQTQENGEKPHFGPDLCAPIQFHQFLFFFFKNLAFSVIRYHGQVSSCKISEKNNDPTLRKFSPYGQTEKQADRRMRVIS